MTAGADSAGANPARVDELIATLGLQPHPEGGHYREIHRTPAADGGRAPMTSIDFLLAGRPQRQFSAWHRVDADEAWHLLEGDGLTLWLVPPDLSRVDAVALGAVAAGRRPRHVVPAHWWQAAEPLGAYAYVGATVAPGFEFSGFAFGRDDPGLRAALTRQDPALLRLL